MRVYRPKLVKQERLPDGRRVTVRGRVTSRHPKGEPVYEKSPTWWVEFRDGPKRVRRSLGVKDEAAARELARDIVRKAERERAGIVDPKDDVRLLPIAKHVEA